MRYCLGAEKLAVLIWTGSGWVRAVKMEGSGRSTKYVIK